MVDPISVTLTLLDLLRGAVDGVQANKEQCTALLDRAQRVAGELQRLTVETRKALNQRGVFTALDVTLQGAAAFCVEFKGRNFLVRAFTHKSDAAKFSEYNKRLLDIVAEANLALALDDRAWRDAQEKDGKTVEALFGCMDQGFGQLQALFSGGLVGLAEQFAELKKMISEMPAQSASSGYTSAGSGGANTAARVGEMLARREIWELDPQEVEYDEEKDARGRRGPVKLGGGSFGVVQRGIMADC